MKKTLGMVVLLVVVVLGGYFSMGLVTERTLKKNLSTLNQANGFSVDLVDYHRGLFKSTADLTWHMQMPEKVVKKDDGHSLIVPPKIYSFDMPLMVAHGPVVFEDGHVRFGLGAAHGQLSLPNAYVSDFSNMFSSKSTKPRLAIHLFVTYLNKTHLEMELPAFHLVTKGDQKQFEWLGMKSDLRFSPENTRLQGHFTLDGLRLIGERFRVILNKVTSVYDVHKAVNGLFVGDANLKVPVLQVVAKKQTELELKQFEVSSNSMLHDKMFDSSFRAAFVTLVSRDKTYGPGELDVAIKNLDADVLVDLNQRVNQMQQVNITGGQAQQLLLSLLPNLPKLVGKGAVFESALKLRVPEGAINSSMHVVFPVSETDAPLQVLPKIEGEGHFSVPAPFLKTLLVRSFKQQLTRAEAVASAEKQNKEVSNKRPLAPSITSAEPKVAEKKDTATPVTTATLDQQAVHHADQKLADLIQVGVLQAKGADYVLELKLSSGRLLVNGHPFHSGMLSF
ncbi:MAG: YdgA family protein [Gammaproteobacteria bacterium]|nr:YdgA family protein [Gammaproteobacteria bacterium]